MPVPSYLQPVVSVPMQRGAADRLAAIKAKGQVGICIWPEYYSISWRNPRTNELEGLDIDMGRTLANRLGVRPVFVETTLGEFMDRIEQGDCDIAMSAIGITPSRAQRVAFSKPYLASPAYAVASKEANRVMNWADLDKPGNAIAVTAGSVMENLMRDMLKSAELVVIRPPATREQELKAGRVDAFISDYPYTRRFSAQSDWARVIEPPQRFGEILYAYAVPRNDLTWLGEVNAFLAGIKVDGSLSRSAARYGLQSIVLY
ncbi:amino acid ABC transporter substrate-binding protein [Acetobacteraceae bacterium H6797]|nr:amino acid ABC transporter substrate-binding protein [Acetobacteraceae bacterium H6797]